ncbi:universal stress protein [Streptomyces sp. NPDC059696]|uniref:universal stress protein n=1 Tax=Streptomyces sp. NPDC059696 TaxID=3346911 RepID=UPI003691A214
MRTEELEGRGPLVVGVDPDPGRQTAVAWAADEADRRRVPLKLVHAQWRDDPRTASDDALKAAVAFARARCPGLPVAALAAEGHPARILAEQSHGATQVVIGSRHRGAAQELFGSAAVALPLTARAACPVIVLREPEHITQDPPYFVVGVDGSPHAAAAIDLAFEEASLRGGAVLRALYVWHTPLLGVLDEDAALRECRRILSETVAGRTATHPEVVLRHEVVKGHPVRTLVDASAHALGLVVGTRGHGGFSGMLLGSVSQGVIHHARCPVLVVPRPRER